MVEYLQAPEQDVVISSRVRLSRNYDDLPFSPKLTREAAEEVVARTSDAVFRGSGGQSFSLLRMGELEQDARSRLVEHHLISYDLLKFADRSAAMVSADGTATVMLNEEDHVRLQGLLPGLQLERAAELALGLDESVGEKYPFAFDSQLGFLTACPANTGTGMRCSVVLHLPALSGGGQMGAVMQAVAKLGADDPRAVRRRHDGARGTSISCPIRRRWAASEEDVVRSLAAATQQIVGHERAMREAAEKRDMMQLQDALMRSWGELMYARLMPIDIRIGSSCAGIRISAMRRAWAISTRRCQRWTC